MGTSGKNDNPDPSCPLPPPLDRRAWEHVVRTLKLPPQQERIAALIVQCNGDRQIAQELGVRCCTVRTYLNRIFERAEVADRNRLVRRIYAIAIEGRLHGEGHQS